MVYEMKLRTNILKYTVIPWLLLLTYLKSSMTNPYCLLNCGKHLLHQNYFCRVFDLLRYQNMNFKYHTIKFTDATRMGILKNINSIRNFYAKRNNVSNMNVVNWDRELEFLANSFVSLRTSKKVYLSPEGSLYISTGNHCLRSTKLNVDMLFEVRFFTPDRDTFEPTPQIREGMKYVYFKRNPRYGLAHHFVNLTRRLRTRKSEDLFNPSSFEDTGNVSYAAALMWAKLERVGCTLAPMRVEDTPVEYYRIDLGCLYGATGPPPRTEGEEVYKIGAPCSECSDGQTCNMIYPNLCGECEAAATTSFLFDNFFWTGVAKSKPPDKRFWRIFSKGYCCSAFFLVILIFNFFIFIVS